jgi:DNA-binding GntR family transcriptional regulator
VTDALSPATDSSRVVGAIRDAILRGDFVPGQRLVEADLSEQFSAPRAAVRSAILELARDRLVERIAHRGARVRVVPFDEAVEIYEVRMAVEALCGAKAAERVTDQEIIELREIGTRMQAAVAAGDVYGYTQLNPLLHELIRKLSRQATAADVLEKLRAQSVRHQFRLATQPGRPSVSLPEHLAIIEAICSRDPEAADAAVRAHLTSVIQAMHIANEAVS